MGSSPFSKRIKALPLAALMLLGTLAPTAQAVAAPPMSASPPAVPERRQRMNLRVFDRVWTEVARDYYDPHLHGVNWRQARVDYRDQAALAPDDRTLYRVVNRMLDLLDDAHAGAIAPAAARRRDHANERRAALGVTLYRQDDESWRIEAVRPGSPAEAAGVRVGWTLLSLDGQPWGPDVEVIGGAPVVLSLRDEAGQPRVVTVTPQAMDPLPVFVAARPNPETLVLSVQSFDPGLGRWMGRQLQDLSPDVDVVLDLRGNPGGRLLEADAVLACFLPRDRAWATRTGRTGRAVTLKVSQRCGDLHGPATNELAVLVDGASRSAAELTPAALQEAGRAVVVGERTGGAVLIAQDTDLPDGGRLTLSRADFVTRGGVRLEKTGVTPDVVVTRTLDDRREGRDPMLDAAVSALETASAARAAVS